MLEAVVGTESAERILMFLAARKKGYAKEISDFWDMNLSVCQNQLGRMERDGLLTSEKSGRTKVYSFNKRYAFSDDVQQLFLKALGYCPKHLQADLKLNRKRPRRSGKPL
ncbi:MAG: winged helix-turn-helix domain-containing protein [Halioglobus sp.]|nr:winged helix-turn-helix domain-containing protein [Halioglobus sp.]